MRPHTESRVNGCTKPPAAWPKIGVGRAFMPDWRTPVNFEHVGHKCPTYGLRHTAYNVFGMERRAKTVLAVQVGCVALPRTRSETFAKVSACVQRRLTVWKTKEAV